MASKYNPIVDTLVSAPVVNLANWGAAKRSAIDIGVTVGTDDWYFPLNAAEGLISGLFYGSPGANQSGEGSVLFNVADRPRLKSLVVRCNFADGLLPISNQNDSPAFDGTGLFGVFVGGGYNFDNNMAASIGTWRVKSDDTFARGDVNVAAGVPGWRLPFGGFSLPMMIDLPERRMTTPGGNSFYPGPNDIIAPVSDKGFVLSAAMESFDILAPSDRLIFSTLTIDPTFQNKRILVWMELVVEHTFPLGVKPS